MLKHTEQYSALIDKYMVRHLVKPGVTGWAQVTGYRGETKTLEQMEGRVKRDVWYIENWTFFLDLKIIVVTVLNMFKGEKNAICCTLFADLCNLYLYLCYIRARWEE